MYNFCLCIFEVLFKNNLQFCSFHKEIYSIMLLNMKMAFKWSKIIIGPSHICNKNLYHCFRQFQQIVVQIKRIYCYLTIKFFREYVYVYKLLTRQEFIYFTYSFSALNIYFYFVEKNILKILIFPFVVSISIMIFYYLQNIYT